MKKDNDAYLLPLLIDLVNPSPAIGWENRERSSFLERCSFDLTLNLALIHHLAIANNLPLRLIAETLSRYTKYAVIEFVPKTDSNAKKLLVNRQDIFTDYNERSFEKEFLDFFTIIESVKIKDSSRTIYLLKKRN